MRYRTKRRVIKMKNEIVDELNRRIEEEHEELEPEAARALESFYGWFVEKYFL
jgi:hypothetical protein